MALLIIYHYQNNQRRAFWRNLVASMDLWQDPAATALLWPYLLEWRLVTKRNGVKNLNRIIKKSCLFSCLQMGRGMNAWLILACRMLNALWKIWMATTKISSKYEHIHVVHFHNWHCYCGISFVCFLRPCEVPRLAREVLVRLVYPTSCANRLLIRIPTTFHLRII